MVFYSSISINNYNISSRIFWISTEQLETSNDLIQFFDLTLAPLVEEFLFRGILIGIPIFLLYSNRFSFQFLLNRYGDHGKTLKLLKKGRDYS